MRPTTTCNGLKWTISVSDVLELLQIVLEPDTGGVTNGVRARHRKCGSEDVKPPRKVNCEILHRLERKTKYFL